MAETNLDDYRTAYTVSIDAAPRFGVTTGISAQDRATTIRVAVDPATAPTDLRHGGHVFPLRARDGGVLQRVGHTEAAVDLARLAGLRPAGVICEILNEDGTTARRPQLEAFADEHGLTFITVAQLVAYRLKNERLVHRVAEARLPTDFGEWRIVGYKNDVDDARARRARVRRHRRRRETCSSACTRSVSPATSSTRCAATAAGSSTRRWR